MVISSSGSESWNAAAWGEFEALSFLLRISREGKPGTEDLIYFDLGSSKSW